MTYEKLQRYLCPVCRAGGASPLTMKVPMCHRCLPKGLTHKMVTGVNNRPDDPEIRTRWAEEDRLKQEFAMPNTAQTKERW